MIVTLTFMDALFDDIRLAPLAFNQRPLQDSEGKVGPCSHEPGEKRTAKRAPSFEMFRLLADPERIPSLSLLGVDSNYMARTDALHEALSLL